MTPPPTIHVQPAAVDVTGMIDLYVSVGWGVRESYKAASVEAMFAATTFVAVAESNGTLAGMIRVLSDRVSVSWIAELAVRPDFQRMGIGRSLFEVAVAELGHTAIYADVSAGAEGFFESVGLRARPRYLTAYSRGPSGR